MAGKLSFIEEQAFQLSQAALALDKARASRAGDPEGFAAALAKNLDVWVVIRTIAQQPGIDYSDDLRKNLINLSHFVSNSTLGDVDTIGDSTIDTLININLQISEGLLEGAARR